MKPISKRGLIILLLVFAGCFHEKQEAERNGLLPDVFADKLHETIEADNKKSREAYMEALRDQKPPESKL